VITRGEQVTERGGAAQIAEEQRLRQEAAAADFFVAVG